MERRSFSVCLVMLAGNWASVQTCHAAQVSELDAASAIRIALERGANAAVGLLGKPDGFLGNPRVRIPLPGHLADAAKLLNALGQQQRVEELITAMNRAAEAAVPKAKTLLVGAVKAMSLDDARRIVSGGDNSATSFFSEKTRTSLEKEFLPIVTRATEQVTLAEKYNKLASKAASLGLVDKQDSSIQQYVMVLALDGLYLMIGEEESKIRKNPVATGSAILKNVFGSLK